MRFVRDLAYLTVATVSAPVWLTRLLLTGKIRTDWPARLGRGRDHGEKTGRRILVHAVSVGEVNAIRCLVDGLEGDARIEVVVATTTDTGWARARDVFGTERVVRYPLDFSWSVARFLDRVRPDVVVLTELEVWPTFVATCVARSIPVAVINGRLTARSAKRYGLVRGLVQNTFARLALVAVQNEAYAARFASLGVPPECVEVTGTMKWDTASIADEVAGAETLAKELGIDRTRPLVVAGSTAPEEHALLLDAIPPGAQLLCAPRRPEWFDEAASTLAPCVRRSHGSSQSGSDRFLLDTIGELRAAYALADLVIIGRSFGVRHGS
ncbi:MAG: hypothetical protein HKN46_10810, partial [Acidimicrobiia bacterium]|nr:hypothetical protein [Acidimicrobiia bacterium]